jgi:hypothetical protein
MSRRKRKWTSLSIVVYYILKTGMPPKEFGKDYLSRRREDKILKSHIKRLKDLGYDVAIKKAASSSMKRDNNMVGGWRLILTGGCDPEFETDPAEVKNKAMLP